MGQLSNSGLFSILNSWLNHLVGPEEVIFKNLQVIGKSCKPIPVMILGVLFGNKSYPMAKYLFILTVVLGVAMFMYKDKPVSASQEVDSGIGIGEILLVSNFNKCLKNSNKLRNQFFNNKIRFCL